MRRSSAGYLAALLILATGAAMGAWALRVADIAGRGCW